MTTDSLHTEIENLKIYGDVELVEEDNITNIVIQNFPIPSFYNKESTTLLIRVPKSYPNGNPDMFWTDEDLLLDNDELPNKADNIETYLSKKWRRFSWHPKNWKPGLCNLKTYIEFIKCGLLHAGENRR